MSQNTMHKDLTTSKQFQRLSPGELMTDFTRSPVMLCMFVAIAFHVVVIGLTSLTYINETYFGVPSDEQADRGDVPETVKPLKKSADDKTGTGEKSPAAKNTSKSPTDAGKEDQENGKSAVEKRVEEKASNEELEAIRLLGPNLDINRE